MDAHKLNFFSLIVLCLLGATPTTRPAAPLRASDLDASIDLGKRYLLGAQRPDGSFVYQFDAARGVPDHTRHAVREIGGLWAVALLHHQKPTPQTADAIVRSLKYYDGFARLSPDGGRYFSEPGARKWTTNYVALHVLILTEFLSTSDPIDPSLRKKCEADRAAEVRFLLSLRVGGGRFASGYASEDGRPAAPPSPYADGEALLALVKVAKVTNDEALRDAALTSAAAMYAEYVRSALRADPDSADARAFYQWGSMAFYELYTSGWPDTKAYAARTIAMAKWMIDHQRIVSAEGNTGHAFEGLAVAWELARLINDKNSQAHIANAIDAGLTKLMTWQIASPRADRTAIPEQFSKSAKAQGGVVSAAKSPLIRIDTVQHQLHATMMARQFMFRAEAAAAGQ
jgi:hypothetical protein